MTSEGGDDSNVRDDNEADDDSDMQHRTSDPSSKSDLRTAALAKRAALSSEHCAAAAQAIASRGLPIEITNGAVVAGYSPIRSEIDPAPLMQKLAADGARLALPAIAARGQSLPIRVWAPHDRVMRRALRTLGPAPRP